MWALYLVVQAAFPCAGLFHGEANFAESEAQEALLVVGTDRVEITYNVRYSGDGEGFGWIIPVPGAVISVEDGDPTTFEELHSLTDPFVSVIEEGGGPSLGCGGTALKGGDRQFPNDVLLDEGFTGTYSYAVLAGDTTTEVLGWLAENDWEVGASEASLQEYVDDGTFVFVAIELAPSIGGDGLLPPLRVAYEGSDLRFPARMGRHASLDDLRTTLWVQGAEHATIQSGWTTSDSEDLVGTQDEDAVALFDAALYDAAGETAHYTRTWAGLSGTLSVTRFDTWADKEVHTSDVVFAMDGGDDNHETTLRLYETLPAGVALWLPLVGLGWLRQRRS